MNTNGMVLVKGGRIRRRRHSEQFKAPAVAACRRPGVSIAAVALANGLNANLPRRWVVQREAHSKPLTTPVAAIAAGGAVSAFVPVAVTGNYAEFFRRASISCSGERSGLTV